MKHKKQIVWGIVAGFILILAICAVVIMWNTVVDLIPVNEEPINQHYLASTMREISEKSRIKKLEELDGLIVPECFTLDERRFFKQVITHISSDAKNGQNETKIYMVYDYSIWTENMTAYLRGLGYELDLQNNLVSW